MESKQYLFFACPFTSRIWSVIQVWLRIKKEMNTLESAIKWLKMEFGGCRVFARAARLGFATTVYELWMGRNALRFDGTKPSSDTIVAKIKGLVVNPYSGLKIAGQTAIVAAAFEVVVVAATYCADSGSSLLGTAPRTASPGIVSGAFRLVSAQMASTTDAYEARCVAVWCFEL
ncbi:hypothetical protein LIER_36134 [Lithospermum erythrorhizon]|uniref:Uncharacterized protein n=1 Tax=Lithospermum erythrorhizon TaxID=34254 RepID=A0AAV3P1J2_LITER